MMNDRVNERPSPRSTDEPLPSKPAPLRPARERIEVGMVNPGAIEVWFVRVLQFVLIILVVLSFIGTFYGMRDQTAPLSLQIISDVIAHPEAAILALIVQGLLSITQYGSRIMSKSRNDRRWWILYLFALALSLMYNMEAYGETVRGMLPDELSAQGKTIASFLFVLAGDVVPEILAVRKRK